ncbi:AraC family transcriptional regulator [Herbiconiux ginsengi]|uniref:Methylphosphotriester-DNA--protein-cysteine methyltransferase (N-terminal of Ada), contains Zn-binding and two AraC-type DNA-binding domains n=1 Tax=Herbiconiux ginsengi TaxID=381665 RepID=A0A1H3SP93_9MICO|nr:AraC family transcriptional regulator [Herbiconiux ginsengi]SDZ39802.1 Methylphosphotriester-DNA--protein-cysteine methyltransferase (N-terminal fragment of Ada), contains Zn-binding and two AraC-type DNA-binding domains [Herbiconiux ginsengi]
MTLNQQQPMTAHRGLVGDDAWAWVARNGWSGSAPSLLQLSANRLSTESFSVARIWQSGARLSRMPDGKGEAVLILIGIDGLSTVRSGGREWILGPNRILIADISAPIELRSSDPTARLEVLTSRHRLGTSVMLLREPILAMDIEDGYWRTLAALVVTVLGTGIDTGDPGFLSLRTAIESVITAAVAQSASTPGALRQSHVSALSRAQRAIEERYSDPAFSASELARSLAVSPAQLHRLFAPTQTRPYQLIQRRRATRAIDLLAQSPDAGAHAELVASQSGFPSVRTMWRTLKLMDAV